MTTPDNDANLASSGLPPYAASSDASGTTDPASSGVPSSYATPIYPTQSYPSTAYGAPMVSRTNGMAIASLVLSLASFIAIPFLGSILGIVFGHVSLSQIDRTGEQGRGIGIAGLVIGYVGLGLIALGVLFWVLFFGAFVVGGAVTHSY